MDYSGMTVNERLAVSGLFKEFDKAVRKKDKMKLVEILKEVSLSDANIDDILRKYKIGH
ncbi:hypothetical protein BY457_10610 [Marinilabilia salmonicolor]|jgi:hypothetical protein|uniref:hypothetical protein n=1 Tax=Marinilabilia salmonicolor TaxID=989 RepID=UPI000D450B47|nr:hypothetical protein [Marinilabilia salmonicolor]PRZ00186.1 hypothetical protein BY457_10610 [Marinilabilia salmonicolor]